jgi:hypothetical protein
MDAGVPHSGSNCVRLTATASSSNLYTLLKTNADDKAPIPIAYDTGI